MKLDIEKLKGLAEAAIEQHAQWVAAGEPWPMWNVRLLEMQSAANPAAVLELIDAYQSARDRKNSIVMLQMENEQLKEDAVTWKGGISALGEALKKLTFCARTVTAGPDGALMAACDAAENALSLIGVSRAIDYIEGLKTENEDGLAVIRTQKEQLNCYMKDAERYRILRDERFRAGCLSSNPEMAKYLNEYLICGDKMDAVIDAEIAKEAI